MSYKKSITVTVASLIAFILLGALFNWAVNPYYLFNDAGLVPKKTAITTKQRNYKAYQVESGTLEIIIAGNSRAEMGLNPSHPCIKSNAFNAAMPGINLNTQAHYIRHALIKNELKQVIWAIDFTDFLEREPFNPLPSHTHLLVGAAGDKNSEYGLYKAKNTLKALFTLGAITDSVSTILKQKNDSVSFRDDKGFNPAFGYYNNIIKHEGQHILFRQKNDELISRYSAPSPVYRSKAGYPYKDFASLLTLLKERGIKITLIVNPLHKDMMSILKQAKYRDSILKWTNDIYVLAEQNNAELWSFFDFSPHNLEQSPKTKSDKPLVWFWEPAHYKQEYGDLMLNQIFTSSCPQDSAEELGIRITDNTLPTYLEQLKTGFDLL